jgi:hypothetical protein
LQLGLEVVGLENFSNPTTSYLQEEEEG